MINDDLTAEDAINHLRHELANPSVTEERKNTLLKGGAEMIQIMENLLEMDKDKTVFRDPLRKEMHLLIRGLSEVIEENR